MYKTAGIIALGLIGMGLLISMSNAKPKRR